MSQIKGQALHDLKINTLRLLLRPPEKADIISRNIFLPGSLKDDIEECADPETNLSDTLILNILIKYFHAYIYPDSISQRLSLKEISTCINQFIHRRSGSELLWDRGELRKTMLKYGFALAMLADFSKTAHIFKDIACRRINPTVFSQCFAGLDIGSGTGILMLAQWLCAKRNNFTDIDITGIERDRHISDRSGTLSDSLSMGRVICGDAKKKSTYSFLANRPVTFITNETLPGSSARLWKEDFIKINQVVFDNFAYLMAHTSFFPNRVAASDKSGKHMVILSPDNCFHKIHGPPLHLMCPSAIELEDCFTPLPEVGKHIRHHLNSPWNEILSHRW